MNMKTINMAAMALSALLCLTTTGVVAQTETLLTTITATAKEQASYSTANVATVSFSYTAGGSSAYFANWGWWGYGWSATVNAAEGYTITKCVFYDDQNRTATDSEAPFVVETTEEDKTPKVNGTPILAYTSKGIKKIEVYGYANAVAVTSVSLSQTEATLNIGETLTLTATVTPDDATDKTVKWSVGGTNAGAVKLYTDETCTTEVGTDATSALTVYALGLSAGEATVTVASNADATKSATCTVTVSVPASAYETWAAANGVTGELGDKDANGIYNAFRYVFGQPTGDFALIADIDVGESEVVITTPAVANSDGVTVLVVESSDLAGETVTDTKALEAEGRAEFTKSAETPRFYRLKAVEAE